MDPNDKKYDGIVTEVPDVIPEIAAEPEPPAPESTEPPPPAPEDTAPVSTEPVSTEPPKATGTEPQALPAEEPKTDDAPTVEGLQSEIEKLRNRYGYLQRQIEKKAAAPAAPAEPGTEKLPEGVPPKPEEDDFENYVDFIDALTDWKVDVKIAGFQKGGDPGAPAGEPTPEDIEFQDKLSKSRALHDDFDQVAFDATVPITHTMLEILKADCDNPGEVAYYLAKNRAECQAIAGMTPTRAAIAISKIEAGIPASAAPPPAADTPAPPDPNKKVVSSAPEPISATGPGMVITKDPNKMNQAEYEQWRQGK